MVDGALIKRLRKERNMTQRTLAIKANITLVTLGNIENGHITKPKMETVSRIAKALNMTSEKLMRAGW